MSKGIQIIDPEEAFKLRLEGAVFTLRRLDSATLMAIERRHAHTPSEARRQRINDDVLDYIIRDWKGVFSPLGGEEVPCTRENKLRLPTSIKLKLLEAAGRPRAEDIP